MVGVKTLNSRQKQAVMHFRGPALVIAGAGTGKTAVIALRIAHLIQNRGIPAQRVLALTFTEKAAAEMQDRVDDLLPFGYVDVNISTFHALGDKILREHSIEIGLQSDFLVMSSFQQTVMMQKVLADLPIKHYKPLGSPHSFVTALLQLISRLKDENIPPEIFASKIAKAISQKCNLDKKEQQRQKELSMIYTAYQKTCLSKGMIDYGDQIRLVIELFEKRPAILAKYQLEYEYILVDEYQDTNYSQDYLLKLLSKKHQNIMVVGDDDQSIYAFRGANIANILHFVKGYKKVKQIVLLDNYRSSKVILNSAYKLIQYNNPYRLEIENKISKKLRTAKKNGSVLQSSYTSTVEETHAIASEIKQLHEKSRVPYSDMAILLRKNSQAPAFAQALSALSVPFVVFDSQNLFEQPEIRLLVHFIHILIDPYASSALYGLLVSDVFKVNLADIAKLSSMASRKHMSLEEYLRQNVNAPLPKNISRVLLILDEYRMQVRGEGAGQLLYRFINNSGYLTQLIEEAEKDNTAAQKIQNIAQFFGLLREFELVESTDPHIFAFWRHLLSIQASEIDYLIETSPLDTNAVSIMTIHKAKGLEFEAVFMPDLNEQVFPSRKMTDKIPLPEGFVSKNDKDINWHILEERRLFYVGMTRSKSRLYLSSAYDHGGKRLRKPSRFIAETTNKLQLQPTDTITNHISAINQFDILPKQDFDPIAKYQTKDGWLHLSTNQINDYLRSPKEFWYFDVLSLPKGPFHSLVYGSAIHVALEAYYNAKLQQKSITAKRMVQVFENSWKSEGFVSLQHEKDRFKAGRATLKLFYKLQQNSTEIPLYVEKPFVLTLPKLKLRISGRYDAVFSIDKLIEIRDFKTGDIANEKAAQKRLSDSIQMKIYALAWEKSQNSKTVGKISLYFVESNLLVTSAKIDHDKTLNILQKVTDGIRSRQFDALGSSRVRFGAIL